MSCIARTSAPPGILAPPARRSPQAPTAVSAAVAMPARHTACHAAFALRFRGRMRHLPQARREIDDRVYRDPRDHDEIPIERVLAHVHEALAFDGLLAHEDP